jgi:hypothetical protein
MAQFLVGDFLQAKADLYLAPTNGECRSDGGLVMGRGAAAALKRRYPRAARDFGDMLLQQFGSGVVTYGLLLHPSDPIGCFQSKMRWKDPSPLELIEYSTARLLEHLQANPVSVAMAMPGVGLGGLTLADVRPIIERLPDVVSVFEFA